MEFLDFAADRREVELALAVSRPLAREECERLQESGVERANIETEAQFWVGPFGFPMIDNTRLSRSERCSVSVIRILDNSVTVAISYFPASRASLKDKPYLRRGAAGPAAQPVGVERAVGAEAGAARAQRRLEPAGAGEAGRRPAPGTAAPPAAAGRCRSRVTAPSASSSVP